MKNSNVYALLISVGDYEAIGLKNLPTYKGDPVLLGTSLTLGLNVPQDQIRIISGDERRDLCALPHLRGQSVR